MTEPHKELFPRHVFTVEIPNLGPVGYFLNCHGLELEFEVLTYAEGGNNELVHHLPGRLMYPNLSLSAGMTVDEKLINWFAETKTKATKQEITLTLHIEGSDTKRRWTFVDAFPVKWTGPSLESSSGDVATETLLIAHGGLKAA